MTSLLRVVIFQMTMVGFHLNLHAQEYLITVTGNVSASEMTVALPHEHLVTNFIGADSVNVPEDIDSKSVEKFIPHFNQLKANGVNFVFECTPAYIGRDVKLLREISKRSGVHIVTNTGIYAAVNKKYVPAFVYKESAEAIAQRWENEFLQGIEGTGVKPGFIKLGVDKGPLDSVENKLLRAAIKVSKKTGLTIAVHTGDYAAASSEYETVVRENYDPSKLVWVHAQNASDAERKDLASRGMYISLDGVSETNFQDYAERILFMKRNNLLHKIILSHDDGWAVLSNGSYERLELFGNGNTIPYSTIHTKLIPVLKSKGITGAEVELIMRGNVIKCFAIGK
jgi:phosphotriesterase-related protein